MMQFGTIFIHVLLNVSLLLLLLLLLLLILLILNLASLGIFQRKEKLMNTIKVWNNLPDWRRSIVTGA